MIANQTTNSYVESAIGKNIVIIGHPTVTERYVSLLSQFFEEKETEHIDYLNSDFIISDTFITKLDAIQRIHKVDPKLILEHSVREILGVILDPVEQTKAIFIGDSRSDEALILGVQPEKVVNDWLIFWEKTRCR